MLRVTSGGDSASQMLKGSRRSTASRIRSLRRSDWHALPTKHAGGDRGLTIMRSPHQPSRKCASQRSGPAGGDRRGGVWVPLRELADERADRAAAARVPVNSSLPTAGSADRHDLARKSSSDRSAGRTLVASTHLILSPAH